MPDSDEKLYLDGLDLNNDGGPFVIESMVFKQAQKKVQTVDNADADGEVFVDEAHYTNSFFEQMRIRVEPQESMDEALDLLAQLTDKLQKAERMAAAGGVPLPWTPAGSTKTWTWYALLGEYEEIPITPTGELAGWFINSPIVTVKLTCRPFGYGEEEQVLAPVESSLPLQVAKLKDPGGDVPAEARLLITEKASQDRRHGEFGLEQLDSDADDPALLVDSDSMTIAGFAGTQTTRAGSYDPNASGNNVIRATAVSSPVIMCSTGVLANIGSFRGKPRIYALSEDLRMRLSYKVGDGPFEALEWMRPAVINEYSELDLGELTFDRLSKGEQKGEIRIEVKSLGSKTDIDVDFLSLIPTTKGYGKARGLASSDATNLVSYEEFDQEAGNATGGYTAADISAITAANPGVITSTGHGLNNGDRVWIEGIVGTMGEVLRGFFTVAGVAANTFNVGVSTVGKGYTSGGKISKGGKTLPLPASSKWYGIGDTDDGAVNATTHTFERTAKSDSSVETGGRFFIIDTAPIGSVKAQGNFKQGAALAVMSTDSFNFRQGPVVRFKDINNWLMAVVTSKDTSKEDLFGGGTSHGYMALYLVKRVAGTVTKIKTPLVVPSDVTPASEATIAVAVDAAGVYQVWSAPAGSSLGSPKIEGQDNDLRTGGALATGQIGHYDAYIKAESNTRTVDNLNYLTPSEAGRVCFAGQSAEVNAADDWVREDADGDDWGAPSIYRGASFYLPVAGDTSAINRLAVKLRRNDTDSEADSNIADAQSLEVLATPRVLVPR